jgi:hypothetical protein
MDRKRAEKMAMVVSIDKFCGAPGRPVQIIAR